MMTLLRRADSVELPSKAFEVAAEARVHLGERGVDLSGERQTKTRTALERFAGALAAG